MTPHRRDTVLVLARGRSRRMGRAKGLCRLGPAGPTLVERIADLYGTIDLPVVVSTLPELLTAYEGCLKDRPWVACRAHPGGDDTARTALAGWRTDFAGPERPTHLWLHPVDLPLVCPATLSVLIAASWDQPAHVVRPCVTGQPGHPVIVPGPLLDWALARFETFATLAMRDVIAAWVTAGGADLTDVAVDDPGCVTDMDDPATLARWGKEETP